jgi:DNA-binding transcriptional LysR family regulator
LRETSALLETLRAVGDEPSGELRIGVPAELPPHGCAIVCGLLQARFPRLHVHVRVSPNPIAELLEHVDLALHVGARPDAGRVQVRALTQVSDGLWASRTYVQRHGLPRSLDDLRGHTLLGSEPGELQRWPLCDGGDVEVAARQTSSDPQLLHRLVSLGFGVALLSEVDGPAFADEDDALVPILEGVVGRTRALSVVVPDVLAETAKLRAVVGQLERIVTGHDAPTRPQPSPSESLSVVPARQMM